VTRGAGDRLFRLLLRLYPPRFRDRFGDDMTQFHHDRLRAEPVHGVRAAALWWRVLVDTARAAAAERARDMRESLATRHLHQTSRHTGDGMISSIRYDVRHALRGMLRRPAFSAVVLLTLALGIGANAAIFSVLDGVLLRPLPFADAERVVDVRHQDPYFMVSEPEFMDYRREVRW
jgi:hypothetical protein